MNAKKVIALGVTGGIAAYKAADLCSRLTRESFDVQVLMTANAERFATDRHRPRFRPQGGSGARREQV